MTIHLKYSTKHPGLPALSLHHLKSLHHGAALNSSKELSSHFPVGEIKSRTYSMWKDSRAGTYQNV